MMWRKRTLYIAGVLAIMLAVSAVFATGVVDVSILTSQPAAPDSVANISFAPDPIIVDYVNNPGYQIGDTFVLSINISDVTDLFTWQANVTWNPGMFNFTNGVVYGDFLARTDSPWGTSRIEPIVGGDNVTAYAYVAETILDSRVGAAGITGSGRLVTMSFLVLNYGCSNFTISVSGTLPTTLLNSTDGAPPVSFVSTQGYFKNKLFGDSNGDMIVNVLDMGLLSASWTGVVGALPYSRDVDNNDDGVVNVLDMGISSANWGRVVP